jgi:hypothetical protein
VKLLNTKNGLSHVLKDAEAAGGNGQTTKVNDERDGT